MEQHFWLLFTFLGIVTAQCRFTLAVSHIFLLPGMTSFMFLFCFVLFWKVLLCSPR